MGLHGSHGRGPTIAPYVWGAIGAVLGYLGGSLGGDGTLSTRVEAVLVGMFSAFIGAEFIALYVLSAESFKGITAAKGGMAVMGAVIGLGLLMAMRRAVGPMKAGKSKRRHD